MTPNEWLDFEIRQENFHSAISRALFELSQTPNCPERVVVEGRLNEAQYFFDLMADKLEKQF